MSDSYRVLITGSRDFTDREAMRSALQGARKRAEGRHMTIVHGGARGADALAAELATVAKSADPELWPALWRRAPEGTFPENTGPAGHSNPKLPPYYRDEALHQHEHSRWSPNFDRAAGFARNEAMIESGIDEVLAFRKADAANRGTDGAIAAAKRHGLTVRITESV